MLVLLHVHWRVWPPGFFPRLRLHTATASDCPAMLQLQVSLKLELFLVSSVIFHRGVKLVAAKMIGLDDVPSTSSDSVASSSCEEDIHELYD